MAVAMEVVRRTYAGVEPTGMTEGDVETREREEAR